MNIKNKQTGAILITSLILLVIMTVVGVSATKVSTISLLIAGNDQQKMLISQEAQTQLNAFAKTTYLNNTYTATGFQSRGGIDNKYTFDQTDVDNIKINKTITKMDYKYACKRGGLASSLGADSPRCDLFDFKVGLKSSHSSAKDFRHQGAGKMVPNDVHSNDVTTGVYNLVN